ncbi:MAG: substrate-binding domain-containing protein [Pirellulales bacterium]|nr:substrate-binding domain-containing protein [Pirellulales bacterium]
METKKHRIIYKYLEEGIRLGKFQPGTQLPTDVEIVQEFGVSRPTVARAMRDLQQLGLIDRRPGAGSYVRERIRKGAHTTLGLLIPELGHSDIFEPICAQIARETQHSELGLMWADSGSSESPSSQGLGRLDILVERVYGACDNFIKQGVSGVFYAPMFGNTDEPDVDERILKRLLEAGIAIVLLDRDYKLFPVRSKYDLVSVDHLAGQLLAAEHLVGVGHQHLTYLQWPGTTDSLEKRISGCRIALERAGLPSENLTVLKGDPRVKEFVEELVNRSSVNAIMCENDMIATHLMQTLSSLGVSVPDELSIVGFNDIKFAQHLGVPLSTVRQPCTDIGKVAVDIMTDRMANPNGPVRTVLLSPKLVVRQSSPAISRNRKGRIA